VARDTRDDRLGEALRRLDVPPHDPAFFTDLERRLRQEDRVRGRGHVRRPRRVTWQRPAILVAAVTFIAVIVTGIVLPPGGPPVLGPEVATATEVRAQVGA
jgi:hypothetical protein